MIDRIVGQQVSQLLSRWPVVVLLGPRQVGKTTLALALAGDRPSTYLDLEASPDLARLSDPILYLQAHEEELVILDEIQRAPDLFNTLRGVIDDGKRRGLGAGRFLILGSASLDLLRQSSESLAGRCITVELPPLVSLEVGTDRAEQDRLWLRGGFPDSFLAAGDNESLEWRTAFLRTYLERDVPQLGPRIPAETLRRLWTMLAHTQGTTLNTSRLAASLGVSGKTVGRYIDLLTDLLLVRRLPPWASNVGKRLVRSPKVYVRDSGVAHALLGIRTLDDLLGHPVAGASWEGQVIETLLAVAPPHTEANFYRATGGAEIDLILTLQDRRTWAIEIKRSLNPRPPRGFHNACDDIRPQARWLVYPGNERFPLGQDVDAIGVLELATKLLQE